MEYMMTLDDFEKKASEVLDSNALSYFNSGSEQMLTLQDNLKAFQRIRFLPRVLTNASEPVLAKTVLRSAVSMPIGLAPVSMQRMAHADGECGAARAAEKHGCVYILSTFANTTIEDVARAAPNANKWLHIYVFKNRDLTLDLIKRAEQCDFKALVMTVDRPYEGRKWPVVREKFAMPSHLSFANVAEKNREMSTKQFAQFLCEPMLTWDDFEWLKQNTRLPIVLKGILRPEDAIKGAELGASAIFVSNHGGRQLDGSAASMDCLKSIVAALDDRCEVYVDGGVRSGTDVLKALALGADCVFFGRPIIHGLAVNGQKGVEKIIEVLKEELQHVLALSGYPDVNRLEKRLVVDSNTFVE